MLNPFDQKMADAFEVNAFLKGTRFACLEVRVRARVRVRVRVRATRFASRLAPPASRLPRRPDPLLTLALAPALALSPTPAPAAAPALA